MTSAPHGCITVDLDGLDCYRAIHGLGGQARGETGGVDPVYDVALPRILDLFDAHAVRATLFVIGRDAERPAQARRLDEAAGRGHELASHSWAHDYGLRGRGIAAIRDDMRRADEAIAEVYGIAPVGFRTPGYNLSPEILEVCAERGYLYDSSVFPCPSYWAAKGAVMAWLKLRRRPSRSQMTRADTLLAPITPYRPSREALWREAPGGELPYEVPICLVPGVRIPIIGTSLHLLGELGFDAVLPLLRRAHPSLLNLEFHGIDFLDRDDPGCDTLVRHQPDLRIPWRTKARRYAHVFERIAGAGYEFAPMETAVRSFAARGRKGLRSA